MVTSFEASLQNISVHHVGNPMQDERYVLSDGPLALKDEIIPRLLMQYFLTPFEKTNEVYHLMHAGGDLHLNEIYAYCTDMFPTKAVFMSCRSK